jgi:spermidine synthase
MEQPLRFYARLEFGIAIAALSYFVVMKGFHAIYPFLYRSMDSDGWMLAVKFLLALILVFPAAFFMGGTVPAMAQAVIHQADRLGRTGAMLYAVNTLGAATGVTLAAFVFIPDGGFSFTYSIALVLSVVGGIIAWRMKPGSVLSVAASKSEAVVPMKKNERLSLTLLCFLSGFVMLALEVVWTRIFAQVHENSVYSYAITLIVVLVGLTIGSLLSSLVARWVKAPWLALGVMTLLGGILLSLGPALLMRVTQGLRPVDSLESWGDYVSGMFRMGFRGVGIVAVILGMVFPFLMKLAEQGDAAPGWKLGRLLAINTVGAILGALCCGFLLLPHWGMWGTLLALTAMNLTMVYLLPLGWGKSGIIIKAVASVFLLLAFTALDPRGYAIYGNKKGMDDGRLLQAWEGSDGTVTVIERTSGHRVIKVNGGYGLGSTEAYLEQAYQSRIPLHLFPETRTVFFLGLGTGISAGAALEPEFPSVQRIVSCELIPEVVDAAKTWIPTEMTNGVFTDPRSEIRIGDGRHMLTASDETYDMINADLFLPYRRGAGSLYSLEHYRVVASRLNEDGVFVQWLPLYQLTEHEFGVIARTMLGVFGEVTMWRNNFQPGLEKVALIGRKTDKPLAVAPAGKREAMLAAVDGLDWQSATPEMVRVSPQAMPFLYAGNLTKSADLFRDFPINTDDKPVIEYQTPITFRKVAQNDKVIWCVGPRLISWMDRLMERCPPEQDPLWADHPEESRHLIRAGLAFHRAMVSKVKADTAVMDEEWADFLQEWKAGAR